jgi:hypothetical protein
MVETPPSYDELFPGRFLKATVDLKDGDRTYTIQALHTEEFPAKSKGGKPEVRGILTFAETNKQMTLNRTNAECLFGLWGETVNWIGKRVTFFAKNVRAFGSTKLAMRVRGSPDLEASRQIEIHVNGETRVVTMNKTGPGAKLNGGKPPPAKMQIIDVPAGEEEPTP